MARYPVHGGHAAVGGAELNDKARVVYEALAEAAPVKEGGQVPAADRFLVAQLARVLVRLDRLTQYVDRHGDVDRRGNVRSAAKWEAKLTSQAVSMMEKLGMSPVSRAKLGLDMARTVNLARGHERA
jgi:hypothetical protein